MGLKHLRPRGAFKDDGERIWTVYVKEKDRGQERPHSTGPPCVPEVREASASQSPVPGADSGHRSVFSTAETTVALGCLPAVPSFLIPPFLDFVIGLATAAQLPFNRKASG